MAKAVLSRMRSFGRGTARLFLESFFGRLCVCAILMWSRLRFLSILLMAAMLGLIALAGLAALGVYFQLRPATEWPIGPALAAILAFIVLLELCSAGLTMLIRATLQLSYDTGRHRIGTLLIMLSLAMAGLPLHAIATSPAVSFDLGVMLALALLAAASSLWFQRAYRRPAYPRFRDFHADVVQARLHLDRAAHGG